MEKWTLYSVGTPHGVNAQQAVGWELTISSAGNLSHRGGGGGGGGFHKRELGRQKPGVAAGILSNPRNLYIKPGLRTSINYAHLLQIQRRMLLLVEHIQIQIQIMMSLYNSSVRKLLCVAWITRRCCQSKNPHPFVHSTSTDVLLHTSSSSHLRLHVIPLMLRLGDCLLPSKGYRKYDYDIWIWSMHVLFPDNCMHNSTNLADLLIVCSLFSL